MRIALVLLLSSLTGCATCRDHPVMCSVAASIVVSSVVTTVALHRAQRQMDAQIGAALAGPPTTALTHP